MEDSCISAGMDRRKFLKLASLAGGGVLLVASGSRAFADDGGPTRVVIPAVNGNTVVQVQNLGSSADTVTMVFQPSNAIGLYIKMRAVGPNSSITFSMPDFTDIPAGLYGSAEVTSASQRITAAANTTK